jgi:phage terminase large subunit GpA-like protein
MVTDLLRESEVQEPLRLDDFSWQSLFQNRKELLTRNFSPWSVMQPFDWATSIRRLPDEHGATKPFSFDYAPYEREMFTECFNERNQEVIFQIFSRGGKSEVVLNVLGYIIGYDIRSRNPCHIPQLHI